MVSGPETARVIAVFQATAETRTKKTNSRHHKQTKHTQLEFARDVKSLSGVKREMGNPFRDDSNDLLVLDSKDLADPVVINTLYQIDKLGQEQHNTYVNERLVNQAKPITDPIRRNYLPLFSRSPVRGKPRTQLQLSLLKNGCSLLSRLFIAFQMRHGHLDDLSAHENQACPPALSQMGKMRLCKKMDLVGCLEDMISPHENVASPHVEVIIFDGAALTNMLVPGGAKTSVYATQVSLPCTRSQLQHAIRVDVVWDEYLPESLKADTLTKRSRGIRRRVESSASIPGNGQAFLQINENKVELFFLATRLAEK